MYFHHQSIYENKETYETNQNYKYFNDVKKRNCHITFVSSVAGGRFHKLKSLQVSMAGDNE